MESQSRYSIVKELVQQKSVALDEIAKLRNEVIHGEAEITLLKAKNKNLIEAKEAKIKELEKGLETLQTISEEAAKPTPTP